MNDEILRMDHVTVEKESEICLDDLNLYLFRGEILGVLVFDNRGKKELIDLLMQNIPLSYGRIYLCGKLTNTYAHSDYSYNKVHIIQQKSGLIPDLTVMDNIFVIRRNFRKWLISRKQLRIQVELQMKKIGVQIDPDRIVDRLSTLERCVVELIKADVEGSRLILLCDIQNFLSSVELEEFHRIIQRYRDWGFSFLYISNHHESLFTICSRMALLSRGTICKIFQKEEMLEQNIRPYVISLDVPMPEKNVLRRDFILHFQKIVTPHMCRISFSVRKGECLLMVDLNNSMLQDIIELMRGQRIPESGKIIYQEEEYNFQTAVRFLKLGIGIISENPVQTSLFWNMSYLDNLMFMLDGKLEKSHVGKRYRKSIIREYGSVLGKSIYAGDLAQVNMPELFDLVYYRMILYHPDLIFCVNPFSVGDVTCRKHVLMLIQKLRKMGITVVILSVLTSDALEVAERLLMFSEGKLVREYAKEEFYMLKN